MEVPFFSGGHPVRLRGGTGQAEAHLGVACLSQVTRRQREHAQPGDLEGGERNVSFRLVSEAHSGGLYVSGGSGSIPFAATSLP